MNHQGVLQNERIFKETKRRRTCPNTEAYVLQFMSVCNMCTYIVYQIHYVEYIIYIYIYLYLFIHLHIQELPCLSKRVHMRRD